MNRADRRKAGVRAHPPKPGLGFRIGRVLCTEAVEHDDAFFRANPNREYYTRVAFDLEADEQQVPHEDRSNPLLMIIRRGIPGQNFKIANALDANEEKMWRDDTWRKLMCGERIARLVWRTRVGESGNLQAIDGLIGVMQAMFGCGRTTVFPDTFSNGEPIPEELKESVAHIHAEHGPEAFCSTRKLVAVHEAGHAVVAMALGRHVTQLKISIIDDDNGNWEGWTGDGEFAVTPQTPPLDDLRCGLRAIAGFMAEVCFLDEEEARAGSSIHERTLLAGCCGNAARKLGVEDNFTLQQMLMTHAHMIFSHHEDTLSSIANRLMGKLEFGPEDLEWLNKQVPAGDFGLDERIAETVASLPKS